MDIGEMVAQAMTKFDEDCPFCTGSDEAEEVTHAYEVHTDEDTDDPDDADDGPYTLINESGILRSKLLPEPQWEILTDDAPAGDKRPHIREGYWHPPNQAGETRSRVCANAHHLIPGNASLGRATPLLKYFAKTVEWIRVRYKPLQTTDPTYGVTRTTHSTDDDGAIVSVETKRSGPKSKKVTTKKTIPGKVKGYVKYDVNGALNGIWLPSNNAVRGWRGVEKEWQKAYVEKAMNQAIPTRQFHDSHKAYSQAVRRVLRNLAKELEAESVKCKEHDKGKDGPPFPAPTKLEGSLTRVSGELRGLVTGTPSVWKSPWITSDKWLG